MKEKLMQILKEILPLFSVSQKIILQDIIVKLKKCDAPDANDLNVLERMLNAREAKLVATKSSPCTINFIPALKIISELRNHEKQKEGTMSELQKSYAKLGDQNILNFLKTHFKQDIILCDQNCGFVCPHLDEVFIVDSPIQVIPATHGQEMHMLRVGGTYRIINHQLQMHRGTNHHHVIDIQEYSYATWQKRVSCIAASLKEIIMINWLNHIHPLDSSI